LKLLHYRFENAIDIAQHVVVPKADDVTTPLLENSRTLRVFGGTQLMLTTVNFDDEFLIERNEIDDVVCDRHLSPELDSVELSTTQSGPEQFFCLGRVAAERSGEFAHRPSPLTLPSPRWGEGFRRRFRRRRSASRNITGFF
jgi:hypothetical protein